MDGYHRQMAPGDYPMAIISITLPSDQVDVNVHPRKMQVKFLDSKTIFGLVVHLIQDTLSQHKVLSVLSPSERGAGGIQEAKSSDHRQPFATAAQQASISTPLFDGNMESLDQTTNMPADANQLNYQNSKIQNYQILGQLRDMYIIVENPDSLRYIDQHALAERIAFEKFRVQIQNSIGSSQTLLHPLTITLPHTADPTKRKDILL